MSYGFTQYGSQPTQQPQTQQYTPQQLQYMQQQMTPQQRLQLMEQQQQQQFAPQQPQQQPQSPYLRGSPVTCVEEARAQMVGMDGAPSYFPDLGNGKIYTKRINEKGVAVVEEYAIVNPQEKQPEVKPETVAVPTPDTKALESRLSAIESRIALFESAYVSDTDTTPLSVKKGKRPIETLTEVASTTEHNREIGHSLESKTSGTNVLALVQLHFN